MVEAQIKIKLLMPPAITTYLFAKAVAWSVKSVIL